MAPFAVAAKKGIVVIDGDGAGRAVPTLPLTSFSITNVRNYTPVAVSNPDNDSLLVFEQKKRKEYLLRSISGLPQYGASSSLALWPDTLGYLFPKCVPGTIMRALCVGKLLTGIQKQKTTLIDSALSTVNSLKGFLIGHGEVVFKRDAEEQSFNFSLTKIYNEQTDETFTVQGVNESLIVYSDKNERPIAMAPDSICYLSYDFKSFTNAEIMDPEKTRKRQYLYIIGIKAHVRLKNKEMYNGLSEIFSNIGYFGRFFSPKKGVHNLADLLLGIYKQQSVK